MGKEFSTTPRRFHGWKPNFAASSLLCRTRVRCDAEKLRQFEPLSMRGQPPLVWDARRIFFRVRQAREQMGLDWSSGVLVTNAGHGAPEVGRRSLIGQIAGCCTNYVFPSEQGAPNWRSACGIGS